MISSHLCIQLSAIYTRICYSDLCKFPFHDIKIEVNIC